MFVEIAFGLVGLALVAFIVYCILLISKISRVVDEAETSIKTLTSDVNVTLYQTNELLAKVNVLTDDVTHKVATIDPLFVAIADLSESVSDLNTEARVLSKKAASAGKNTVKASSMLSAFGLISKILKK
ncbi:General stress protein [Streptococcus sp. DD10]|uniref:DUF948 domain-containing protein n=1 Tax=Streptococcus sp. DD10 TaxID=1777878 RepID=UPI000797284A|nr:DUF948 domain-containing protein [Streptococcus sp. DD10]KXT75161.1 General stress protein [Streptococcus sp. DD10]